MEFKSAFSAFLVIPTKEIEKVFPGFDRNALTRWQKKGYLRKIRNGLYQFSELEIKSEAQLCYIANQLYKPSYVSTFSAMRWYDFIPEGVFSLTSISTKKTKAFQTKIGAFTYQNIKEELFFGYQLEKINQHYFKIAQPEKTILDFLYLEPSYSSIDDFYELRLNVEELKVKLNFTRLDSYVKYFSSKALQERVDLFLTYIDEYDYA